MLNIKLLKYFKFAAPQVRPPRLRLNWVNINAMCYFCLFVFFPELAVFFFLPLLCSRKGMPMLCVKTVLLCFVPEQGTQHVGKQWRRA